MEDPQGADQAPSASPRIRVAIAVLRRDGRILVRRRRADEHLPGLWEFPGGKLREGESAVQAAAREVREEMGVETAGLILAETIAHDYPGRRVLISVFEGACSGDPAPPDGAEWAWITPAGLLGLAMPAANAPLVSRLAAEDRKGER